jgi:hypothetical protein
MKFGLNVSWLFTFVPICGAPGIICCFAGAKPKKFGFAVRAGPRIVVVKIGVVVVVVLPFGPIIVLVRVPVWVWIRTLTGVSAALKAAGGPRRIWLCAGINAPGFSVGGLT